MSMMHIRKNILFKNIPFVLFTFLIICSLPHVSMAQTTPCTPQAASNGFVPLACYSNSSQFTSIFSSNSLSGYINAVFKTALAIGGILAVMRIAYAGYMYMGSADMWGNKQHAREILGDAIIGLLLLFAIYLILNQINPNLLNLNVLQDITPVSQTPASQTPAQQLAGGTIPQ